MVEGLSKDAVLAYLRANPELIAEVMPPIDDRDEAVVDFQRHVISRLQTSLNERVADHDDLVDASRGNLASQQQVHEAVLTLLRPRSLNELTRVLAHELPDQLRIDVALLCLRQGMDWPQSSADAVLFVPMPVLTGEFDTGQLVALQMTDEAPSEIFGPAANLIRSQAMVRLDVNGETAVLALGDRNPATFESGQGTQLLRFLGDVLSAQIERLVLPAEESVAGLVTPSKWSQPDS